MKKIMTVIIVDLDHLVPV